jgi:fumarate reductase subunit C
MSTPAAHNHGLYRRQVPVFWWLGRRSYVAFVLRELSAVFVAWFVVFLLLLIKAISAGSEQYERFLQWSAGPWVLLLNTVAWLFVLLHTVTWFGLAPRAMVVRFRGRRVPRKQILALHYVLWALLSAALAWVILGG